MKTPIRTTLALISTLAACAAADWPKFRGPTGDGHATVKELPLKWSTDENVKWKVAIPGKGWSSPVLAGGRLYLTTAVAAGDDQDAQGVNRELRALCLDAASGRILWDVKVFDQDGAEAPKIHPKNSHASPTPIVDGGRLYAHFGHMGTACLDLDGGILWTQRKLQYPPQHGAGSTPILVQGRLIFSADAASDPFIAALHADDGQVAWKTPRSKSEAAQMFSFCTPSLAPDGRQVISPGSGAVFAYDPASGRELWKLHHGKGWSLVPKPVFHDGMTFFGTGFAQAKLVAVRIDDESMGDVTDSHLEWEITKRAPHTPSMLVVDGLLYFISDGGIASCVNPEDGDIIWQERAAGPMSASPIHAAGRIYFQDEQGVCTVIKAGREFEVLAKNDIGERTLASFAVGEGAIYIRSEQSLFRIGK